MPSYQRTITVAAKPATVFATSADVERWPGWLPTVSSVERLDAGPLRPGARTLIEQPRLPRTVWTVSAYDEGRSFVWRSRAAGVSTTATHVVRPSGAGSELELSVVQSGPLAWLVWVFLGSLTRRYVDREAEATKARCEAG